MNLKVKSKKINDFTYELAISAKWEDIKEDFNIAKKKVAKEIKLPGFRKGKVPENILMSQYINSVEMGFVQDFCEKYYIMALQKEELTPINQAQLKDIDFSYENDLSFKSEFEILKNLKIVVALGKIAFDTCVKFYRENFDYTERVKFGHGTYYKLPNNVLLMGCYHPSPRNVNTGRIDFKKFVALLKSIKNKLNNE